ncbi:MAG: META domain-containing protein [Pyrinomonadaceae bacterium]
MQDLVGSLVLMLTRDPVGSFQRATEQWGNIMKRKILTLVIIAVAAGLMSRQSLAQAGNYATKWKLVELNGRSIKNSPAFIEFNADTKELSGNGTCNRFFGSFELSGRDFRTLGIGTTKRMCLGLKMTQTEAAFLKALADADRLEIKNDLLTLSREDKPLMRFKNAGAGDGRASTTSLNAHKWVLKRIGAREIELGPDVPFLNFDAEKGSAGGNTGCNVFGGNYAADGTSITFSQLISTMRACEADERMSIERGFLDGLQNAKHFEIKGDRLLIRAGNETVLEFEAIAK